VTTGSSPEPRTSGEPDPVVAAGDPGTSRAAKRPGPVRRLYDWTLGWADHPAGERALFGVAVAESSFFPIPPDVLLMALALGKPKRALWFAAIATIGSVIGGIIGYFIGFFLFEQIGRPVLEFYGAMDKFDTVGDLYRENLILALFTAGFTPIPYKVFTIAGGAFGVMLIPFILISFVSRGLRFFLVAGLIRAFGQPVKRFIDRYFNILTIVFVVLLLGGFYVIRVALH
jgi:membrane protein YqaA with SNARE-associated domain